MNRIGAVATILLTLLVVAGCSSGQAGPPTLAPAGIGPDTVDGQVGQIRLLGVAIASPGARGSMHIAGDSAALLLTITNDGKAAEALTGASTDAARQIVFRNGDGPPDPHLQVPVPPGDMAVLHQITGPHLELTGLRENLRSGFSVPVTFEFHDGGSLTLNVPVGTYTDVAVDRIPQPLAER
jgi:periplasmic copper chaperone A